MPRGPLLLAAALAALVAAPAVAQKPDSLQDRRDREPGAQAAPAADTTRRETPEASRPAYVPPRFALSLTVGTHGFDRLQSQPVTALRLDGRGTALDSAVLRRFVEAEGGFRIGASGMLSLGPTWAARVGVGLARTELRTAYEGEAELFVATAARLAPAEVTAATVLSAEAALRMRIPSSRRAQPYLELGAGAIRWSTASAPAGAPEIGAGVLRIAGLAAFGVDVPFSDRLAARIQGTTRAFRTPLGPSAPGTPGPAGRTLAIRFDGTDTGAFADGTQELVTALRLDVGISVGLGGPAAAPADPAAPAASPSPPRR